MASKKGLGRGLDILLPESDAPVGSTEIALSEIDPNPNQPRRDFDAEALQTLADSIRQSGLLQPLLVVREGGRYRIVAGERRFRAARMAGLATVPCVVREMDEQERLEAALIENLQREDLNPMEEAAGIRDLMERCGYTQEMAARRVGRSRPAVANLLRLLALPEDIQRLVREGQLSAGHARVLAGLDSEDAQRALARPPSRIRRPPPSRRRSPWPWSWRICVPGCKAPSACAPCCRAVSNAARWCCNTAPRRSWKPFTLPWNGWRTGKGGMLQCWQICSNPP